MIRLPKEYDPDAPVVVMSIGNTHAAMGVWRDCRVTHFSRTATSSASVLKADFEAFLKRFPKPEDPAAVVIASVVPEVLAQVKTLVESALAKQALVLGEAIPWGMEIGIEGRATVGADRIAGAIAAYDQLRRSCVIVDFGTAITVNFVDDEGVFRGGAILPGIGLQFWALKQKTAQLPEVEPAIPQSVFGRTTVEAIQNGVCRGAAGAVRWLVEHCAAEIGHWPHVVATGGDAEFMTSECDFFDSVVPDLGLRGVGLAYRNHLKAMGA